ncbi:hypothetical protein ACO1O0_004900 [Amphichorda felina]
MPANYIITEPAPSTTTYIRSGRGGAGNTFRVSSSGSSSSHSTTTTRVTTSSSSSSSQSPARRFFSGVGGAGNVHEASERPTVSLDDEVRRMAAREEHAAQIGHCGIGGAGNVYRRKPSDASDRSSGSNCNDDGRSSISSVSSTSKLWARVRGKEY